MSALKNIIQIYDVIEKYVIILMTAVMVVIIFAQVFTRYVLGDALYWSEELGKFIFVWVSWLGVSAGLRDHEHIQVKLLPDFLHKKNLLKTEKINLMLIDFLWLITSIVVFYYGIQIVANQMETGVYGASTGIPMWMCYLCVPFSSAIVCLRLIGQLILGTIDLIRMYRKKSMEGVFDE